MNNSYLVIEKPQHISFTDIHELLWEANQGNRERGFILKTSQYSASELEEYVGEDGKCFVAMDGDRLIGTLSIRFVERKRWYWTGRTAEYCLAAVHPDYRGKHVLSALTEVALQSASSECPLIELSTSDSNTHAIAVYRHYGFQMVDFHANSGGDHYSVVMVKWFQECPFAPFLVKIRFFAKKITTLLRYTPEKKKRFGI